MSFNAQRLMELLPEVYRVQDADQGQPLAQFLGVIAEQMGILEEDLAELYDNQFIETCADWAIPYIGDLIGWHQLHDLANNNATSPRADVANTFSYRRRKGTPAMLEQMAHDVTGWNAHVVEFFQLLATTQYMNHLRPQNLGSPHLGAGIALQPRTSPPNWEKLKRIGSPFERVTHTLDVRNIPRGKYNIPNIGIFLWRLKAYERSNSPAFMKDGHRFLFSPLGNNIQLFNTAPVENSSATPAGPLEVPEPIARRVSQKRIADYYGDTKSIRIRGVDLSQIRFCNLSDTTRGAWAHTPPPSGIVAIDPELGRIAFGDAQQAAPLVTFYEGFSADIGGGIYDRDATFDSDLKPLISVLQPTDTPANLPPGEAAPLTAIADGLAAAANGGAVAIGDSACYKEVFKITAPANATIELRAANYCRPHILLKRELIIDGDATGTVSLSGLLISGGKIIVNAPIKKLILNDCTLVPGISLNNDGTPAQPKEASLVVTESKTQIEITNCILGAVQTSEEAPCAIVDSILDATDASLPAFAGLTGDSKAGSLTIETSTVIGFVSTQILQLASDTIFLSPVNSGQVQSGCVRFCFVRDGSQTPRRYRCQPEMALAVLAKKLGLENAVDLPAPESEATVARLEPQFTSLRFGAPGYCQLSRRCAAEIRCGAEDESEMGVFHDLCAPQRETNLRQRLDEYLRFGLEPGIFYVT